MTIKETKDSSESPSPPLTSFSSLPFDLVLNCLARVSIIYHPYLSFVFKDFRSIVASPELEATRTRIGKTEKHLYVCLGLNIKNDPKPRWFTLDPIHKQEKLLPMPWFPCQRYPKSSTMVSFGSNICIFGGLVKKKRSRRVFLLDSRSHQWRTLPKLRVPRANPAVDLIDGKIHVIGGCRGSGSWREIYDPKTLSSTPTLDLTILTNICLVELENNVSCQIRVFDGGLVWCYAKEENSVWSRITGLEGLFSSFLFPNVANSSDGKRVTVWWKSVVFCRQGGHYTEEHKTKIRCAEISFEIRGLAELWGTVEWCKNVLTMDGCEYSFDFFLNSAIVTH